MDPFQQQQDVERRRALLGAMQQQSQQAPIVGRNGLAQALAKVAQAYVTSRGMKGLGEEEASARQGQNELLSSGMEKYFKTSEGVPGKTLSDGQALALMQNDQDPGQLAEPVKADPRRAVMEAMASQHPTLQQIGQSGMQMLLKKPEQEKFGHTPTTLRDSRGQLVSALIGDRGTVRPMEGYSPKPEFMTVGDRVVDKSDPGKVAADYRPQYETPGPVARDAQGNPIIGQRETGTGKVNPFSGGTNVTVNTGDKAGTKFAETMAVEQGKLVSASREKAVLARDALSSLGTASQQLRAGIKSGITGEFALGVAKAAQALGMGDVDPAVANTETFKATMAREVASMVKNFGAGTGISNADREFAEKAAGGQITLDEATLSRLLTVAQQAAANTLYGHTDLLNRMASTPGAIPEQISTFKVPFEFSAPEGLQFNPKTGRFDTMPSMATPVPKQAPAKGPSVSNW
jgi:hypothetical protein